MRFGTAVVEGARRGVVVERDRAFPLPDGLTVDDLVERGVAEAHGVGGRALAGPGVPLAGLTLGPPLRPRSVRDFVTFRGHVEGVRRSIERSEVIPEAWFDAPAFYFTNPHAIVGPGAPVPRPWGCEALDFELEVAVVVSGGGSSLTEEAAREAVFGYVVLNDWSARDLQQREMQVGLGPAKGKDFCTSLGPWIVTPDELEEDRDPDGFLDLACTVSVNRRDVGADTLAHMGWTFETMIAYASRSSLVLSGDVLASGTTGGGGCLAELWGRSGRQDPPPLRPGDVVSITVEKLGTLTNTIVEGARPPALTPYREPRALDAATAPSRERQ
jgi:2-keto-4-pentenoate hydratase/2-oxohepta-3-ene-1,7-dioic acid hydratase in catechol pathway